MVEIGRINKLRVSRLTEQGAWLKGGDFGEILLPKKQISAKCQKGDKLTVFIFNSNDGGLIATTRRPYAQEGEFAFLNVVSVTEHGAYVDWGLEKDLLVPFNEQIQPLEEGRRYMLRIYLDNSHRLAASCRLDDFLDLKKGDYEAGQEVNLTIAARTEMGFKAIVNNSHWGIIYYDQVFKQLKVGQKTKGFISKIREDGKLDLSMAALGYKKVEGFAQDLLEAIEENDGFMLVNDKSSPETIRRLFGVSKAVFKKAVGQLYKQRIISLENGGLKKN